MPQLEVDVGDFQVLQILGIALELKAGLHKPGVWGVRVMKSGVESYQGMRLQQQDEELSVQGKAESLLQWAQLEFMAHHDDKLELSIPCYAIAQAVHTSIHRRFSRVETLSPFSRRGLWQSSPGLPQFPYRHIVHPEHHPAWSRHFVVPSQVRLMALSWVGVRTTVRQTASRWGFYCATTPRAGGLFLSAHSASPPFLLGPVRLPLPAQHPHALTNPPAGPI
ncbi:hypothetical protein B0O80DRAFT_522508 [Mortierella sp. GBAus27b]|nr:hypothetical protein B0O80DRAFT_522508 [Mortierella sp. GBAus27b]